MKLNSVEGLLNKCKHFFNSYSQENWRDRITCKNDFILNKVDFESHLNATSTEWDRRVATPDCKKVIFHLSTFCGNLE